ncbi:MAG TPA: CoA transferase [Mycobacteriales bacterium]|jgi:crotonobetainyl-CoA:carnitine CoA-transferase CaiB-like acyl-CoA transferase|nr:CoA transferase [Mycobacteriales bacterium]
MDEQAVPVGPLAGIVVADFTRVLAGPYATCMLGDLGADVIKVERPGRGDDTRAWGPPWAPDGTSTYYLSINRNKRSVALDLSTEAGRQHAGQLADRADVLVENFKPGTWERFGLGWDVASVRNPGLIWCSITGFGTGAGAGLPGYDLLVQAVGGLMSMTGEEESGGRPLRSGVAVVDVLTGLHAAVGVLAALRERERSGLGQRLDVNLMSTSLASLVNQSAGFLNAGAVPTRMGNRHPSVAPYETVAARDRELVVAVGNDGQFARLCEVIGCPELATDPRFVTNRARVDNRATLLPLLAAALARQDADHWVAQLTAAGVPAGPVNDLAAAFALAESLGLDAVATTAAADGTVVRTAASPLRFGRTPVSYRRSPPSLGQHTSEVLAELDRT